MIHMSRSLYTHMLRHHIMNVFLQITKTDTFSQHTKHLEILRRTIYYLQETCIRQTHFNCDVRGGWGEEERKTLHYIALTARTRPLYLLQMSLIDPLLVYRSSVLPRRVVGCEKYPILRYIDQEDGNLNTSCDKLVKQILQKFITTKKSCLCFTRCG